MLRVGNGGGRRECECEKEPLGHHIMFHGLAWRLAVWRNVS